jgi:hypothetical protein
LMYVLISLFTSAGEVNGISALSCWMTSGKTSLFLLYSAKRQFLDIPQIFTLFAHYSWPSYYPCSWWVRI